MNKLLFSNMKMNLSYLEVLQYIEKTKDYKDKFVVIPSNIYIPYFIKNNYNVGIQNISEYNNGAYTGEISSSQVKSIGVNYVILGHSERRKLFNETNEIIKNKLTKCLDNDLKVILCIGETKEEKESNKTNNIIREELNILSDIDITNIIIAYEPIWAIGTGVVPTNTEIENITNYIKNIVFDICKKDIKVLYGGSVNEKNISNLSTINNVSGFLIGGACIDYKKMIEIIEKVK